MGSFTFGLWKMLGIVFFLAALYDVSNYHKMEFQKKWFHTGVTPDIDFRLAKRIVLSNQFAFLMALLTLVFMAAFATRKNFDVIPLLVILFVAFLIWLCNLNGLTRMSRFISCVTPACCLLFMNLTLKFGDPTKIDILHYATPRMLILGSSVLPFAMFTPVEKRYMWAAVFFILAIAFGYDAIHNAGGVGYRDLGFQNNFYGVIYEDMIIMAAMILLASGFMFSMGHQYDLKSQKMLSDALEQTEKLKRNEEEMKKTMAELEHSRQQDDARNWVAKGLTEIISILQTADETSVIYDKILRTITRYTDMNQGTLFIAEETETGNVILRQVSCYAYDRKKYTEKVIEPGNGLVGQAFLEGEICYLKDVPRGYVQITSGLGEATPGYVVIVPMKVNTKVEGLFELASFKPLEEHHFDLLSKIAETVASFVSSARVNDKTRILLHKAQVMSEELKANEEEMRQNLEELTATQEAMARKEREYLDKIADLERTLGNLQDGRKARMN
jgi:hypothetical protein